jgi:adenylate cyclase class 2
MPAFKPNQEVEIKLRVADASALRRRLKQLTAREVSPRTYESNTLYDTARKDLARRGQLIRIRVEQPSPIRNKIDRPLPTKTILTYKGPPQAKFRVRPSIARPRKQKSRYKVREEVEVAISGMNEMTRILQALGLRPSFRYEKFRTTYALPGLRNLKIEFDETPIGTFLELEGTPSAIDRVARLLGYTHTDYITQTYGALHVADCRLRGRKPTHMLFQPAKIFQ